MQVATRRLEDVAFKFIQRPSQLGELAADIERAVRTSVDTETNDKVVIRGDWVNLRVVSVGLRFADGSELAYVIDFRDVPAADLAPVMALIEVADAWNADYDELVMSFNGVPVPRWRDAMLTDAVLCAGMTGFHFYHGLGYASSAYLSIDLEGKGTTQTSFDAVSDLTEEQIAYAAQDAIVTLWAGTALDEMAELAGVATIVDIEQGARPFFSQMEQNGFPFDAEGWMAEVAKHETARDEALAKIADLTGGCELTLFGSTGLPSFKVDSDPELKAALNRWVPELVRAATGGVLLDKATSVDKQMLGTMVQLPDMLEADGADAARVGMLRTQTALPKVVLEYRKEAKIVSTYGDSMMEFVGSDGRIHAQYQQALTATGRPKSDKPNAQNMHPDMKRFIRSARVLCHADLSQAEQRVLGQLTGEPELIATLGREGGDIHVDTAQRMFNVEMAALKATDPGLFTKYRKKSKGLSFGIPYGLRGASMGARLTLDTGSEVTTKEANELIDGYYRVNPMVAAWLNERDEYVSSIGKHPGDVDWEGSFRLHELRLLADPARKKFRDTEHRYPTSAELGEAIEPLNARRERLTAELGHEPSQAEMDEEAAKIESDLDWALSYQAPVVLMADGNPFAFESRTAAGRRRLFNVPMDGSKFAGVITSAALTIALTDKPAPAGIRDAFADAHGLNLPRGTNRAGRRDGESQQDARARARKLRQEERNRVVKAFEGTNKPLKLALVREAIEKMGPESGEYLLKNAMADQVRSRANAYRNAPIQGLVADIMLEAMGIIEERLRDFPTALAVQSVHDSVVIECDLADAPAIANMMKEAMEEAMRHWCPDVRAVADADIRRSAHDDDVIATIAADGSVEWIEEPLPLEAAA